MFLNTATTDTTATTATTNSELSVREFLQLKYPELSGYLGDQEELVVPAEEIYSQNGGSFLLALNFIKPEEGLVKFTLGYLPDGKGGIEPLQKGEDNSLGWKGISSFYAPLVDAVESGYFADSAIKPILRWAFAEDSRQFKLCLPDQTLFKATLGITKQTEKTKSFGRNSAQVGTQVNLVFTSVDFEGAYRLSGSSVLARAKTESKRTLAEMAKDYGVDPRPQGGIEFPM